MNACPDAAARAARAILTREHVPHSDAQARAYAQTFYSLAALLPASEPAGEPAPPREDATHGEEPAGRPAAERGTRSRRVRAGLVGLVLLVAIAAVGLAFLLLPRDRFDPRGAIYLEPTAAAPAARGVALLADGQLLLYASGLSELERGYRYVLWSVESGAYRRIGSVVGLGTGNVRLRAGFREEPSRLELTIEPATATGNPSGPTVLAGLASLPRRRR